MMDKTLASQVGEMNVMDSSGHKQLKWDRDRPDEIAAMTQLFDRLVGQGYSGFASKKKMEAKHAIRKFDPTMEELVMVPKIVGG
jgi:hypothetical protein